MLTTLKRLAFAGMFLLPVAAVPLTAQVVTTPSAEGTKIKNIATASYTDANGNTYADAKDSVSVVVGFLAAPNPTGAASVTPASPSTGNVASFTLTNSGNGVDSMTVGVTGAAGLTITGYTYNATNYTTLAALNAAIKLVSLASGGALTVGVTYSVDSVSGGLTLPLTLTQYSVRTPTTSYAATTNVQPPAAFNVAVTPDLATVSKLVSNGAPAYSYYFVIRNTGNTSNTYTLSAALNGAGNGTVLGLTLPTTSITLAAGVKDSVFVNFTVAQGTAPDKIILTATSGAVTNTGDVTVSVQKSALTLSKRAYKSMTGTALDTLVAADAVVPGTAFYYKLAVSNASGAAAAKSVVIKDILPASVSYVSSTADAAGWTISQAAGTVTASLSGDLLAGASRFIWLKVQIATTPATVIP